MKKHTEARFEEAIEHHLIENDRYLKGDPSDFDSELALEPKHLIDFIQKNQEKTWQVLENIHGAETTKVVLADLNKYLETQGMLNVIRYGFKGYQLKPGQTVISNS